MEVGPSSIEWNKGNALELHIGDDGIDKDAFRVSYQSISATVRTQRQILFMKIMKKLMV